MDVPVFAIIMFASLVLTFGLAMPLAGLSRRRRRDRLLRELAPSLGADGPTDVAVPWERRPQRGLELQWRGHRAALVSQPVGRYESYWVLLLGPSLPRIYVRPETSWDRAGKTLGLNREAQTGDFDFDAGVYLETDEPDETVRRALDRPAMREALRAMLTGGHPYVRLGPGAVAARIGHSLNAAPAPEALERALQGLAAVAASAPSIDPSEIRAPSRMRGDLVALVMSLAFMASLVGFYAVPLGYVDYDSPLRSGDQAAAAAVSLAAWLALFPLSWAWMRGHSRSFRNFLTTVILGVLPVMLLGTEALYLANALLDGGAGSAHEVVISRRRAYTRKYEHRYLYIPWWDAPHAETEMEVSRSTYQRFHPGDAVVVTARPGALGWPWAERIELRRASPSHAVTATVRAVTGQAPVAAGAACAFRVSRRPPEQGVEWCQTQIVCGGVTLYGSESRGYFRCAFTDAPPAVSGGDDQTSASDRDPAMRMDTRAGTLSVWDQTPRVTYRVDLLVTRVE
jgi:hypothetical protein